MRNKTAMQELIHWLKSGWKDEDVDTVIKKAEQLLEMEKEQKRDSFNESRLTNPMIGFKHNNFEQYYNETYNVKDN
jgi:hypothetical protein